MICTCIALNHDHEKGKCERKPVIMGGQCLECRHWEVNADIAAGLAKKDNL